MLKLAILIAALVILLAIPLWLAIKLWPMRNGVAIPPSPEFAAGPVSFAIIVLIVIVALTLAKLGII
jgi:hypothetical protein